MKPILALALILCTVGANGAPTSSPPWNAAVRDGLLTQIETNVGDYFFVERVPAIRAAIEAQRTRLDALADPEAFAKETNDLLYAATHDKHLKVHYVAQASPTSGAQEAAALYQLDDYLDHGFEIVARLHGNIGYLRVFGFAPFSSAAKRMLDSAMNEMADTDGLVIDLRDNHGGDKETVDYFLGYFFGTRTQVTGVRRRNGNEVFTQQAFAATDFGGAPYREKPVYVLTSSATFSGGEQFAYDLQAEKRATIVGETTGGGANPGGIRKLNANFGLFVPVGSARSPITNTNWEGVGVLPDTKTSAKDALLEAYTMALRGARNQAAYAVGARTEALQNPAKALEDSLPAI